MVFVDNDPDEQGPRRSVRTTAAREDRKTFGTTPQITDPLPQDVAETFHRLVDELDEAIPPRQLERNLLVATWNLRAFGGVTEKWRSEPGDSPRRDLFDLRCIAEVVSRFDIVAIEEAREDLRALRLVLEALGDSWGLIATDVTRGRAGNNERLVFLFDTRRLRPSGLAGELVVALEEETDVTASDLERQFARTPYAVSFTTGREELTLVVLHVLWGKNEAERVTFIRDVVAIANGIVQDEIEPQEGARILARTCSALWSSEGALQVFVALDHDWDDLPQQRAELAREIVKAADRLRANWGP